MSAELRTQTLGSVENAILATDGVYQAFGGTPTSYVTGLYNAILGRAPDPTGLAYYAGLISAGVPRQDVIHELHELRRGEAHRGRPLVPDRAGLGRTDRRPQGRLGRRCTGPSMIDGGLSDDVVHAMILAAGVAPGRSATAYVTGLYQAALGRAPDPAGLAYFAGQIDQGVSRYDVALELLTTDEGRRTSIARFYQYELGWPDTVREPQGRLGRRILGRHDRRLILTNTSTIAIVIFAGAWV